MFDYNDNAVPLMGVLGYGTGAVLYAVFGLWLLTTARSAPKRWLLLAIFVTSAWSTTAAMLAWGVSVTAAYVFLEICRSLLWLLALIRLLRPLIYTQRRHGGVLGIARPMAYLLSAALVGVQFAPAVLRETFGILFTTDLTIFGHLGLAVGGLVLVEQLFRNTRPEHRWGTKFFYLGIGVLFAFDFFLYADALLFRQLDAQMWAARGFVDAMAVPLFAVAALRNPDWSPNLFVSHRMALHTASVLGAGVYLLVMAGVAYYIRLYGGTWGTAVQLVFMAGAVILLAAMVFSGQLRAYTKVFLSKHFFHYKYDYREEWLKFIGTLSTSEPGDNLRERAIRALAELVDSTGGVLWARNERGDFALISSWHMSEPTIRVEHAGSPLLRFLERRQWVVELDEYASAPDVYAELQLPGWINDAPRAWLIVPLMQLDRLQGLALLARPSASRSINWEDRDLLKTAGRQVASYIALLDTTEALMDARQFEAFNRLSAFVVHDLKNVAAQLSLVVKNAERHRQNPAFIDDAIKTVANATARMNRMLAQLANKGSAFPAEQRVFPVAEALKEVMEISAGRVPTPVLSARVGDSSVFANRDKFVAVLCHLVRNAQEATPADGVVEVNAHVEAGTLVVEIRDTGCGMDERFIRESLFKPFQTTKGNAGMGVGVYETREFVHALGGEIMVESAVGVGTTFSIRVPLHRVASIEVAAEEALLCGN